MSYEKKKLALSGLLEMAQAGERHPDAVSYGVNRDCFDHQLILSTISTNHAESLRLHRELVDDEFITPPRQTSRRQSDGSRLNFQVQRIFGDRVAAELEQIHHADQVEDNVPPWKDPMLKRAIKSYLEDEATRKAIEAAGGRIRSRDDVEPY
jgi:hypothetical protein